VESARIKENEQIFIINLSLIVIIGFLDFKIILKQFVGIRIQFIPISTPIEIFFTFMKNVPENVVGHNETKSYRYTVFTLAAQFCNSSLLKK